MTKARTVAASRKKKAKANRAPSLPPMPEGMMPTPEAQHQQRYETMRLEKDGPKVAVRTGENMLDRLARHGTITKKQAEAGHRYEEDHQRVYGSGGSRDSCIPPVGGIVHETDSQAERIVRAKERLNRVLNLCGPAAYAVLRSVAIYGSRLGADRGTAIENYTRLRRALDAAAQVFGVPDYLAVSGDVESK